MIIRLTLFFCLAVLAFGCAGRTDGQTVEHAPLMTVSDFYGFCSALPTPGACLSDPLCQRYRQELTKAPRDLSDCLAMCRDTEKDLYTDNLVNGCAPILQRAEELCDQFCRRRDKS